MPRTLNPEAHAVRRDAFIDVAQNLIRTKGYEQLSVQDVLDELGASKGAFYHYFDSKVELLEAVVARMVDAATSTITPIVADPNMAALDKLRAVFSGLARWKADRRDLVLALMRIWLSDDNAIVREKLRQGTVTNIAPLLAAIIRQGTEEGVFSAGSPDAVAGVVVSLMQGAGERATELLVARQANVIPFDVVERTLGAYAQAFERIMGMPPGSWTMVDEATLHFWFD